MNRNQKIALGCGGAGCLGLIVVAIASVLIYFFAYNRPYSTNRNDDNFNVTTNRNSNSNNANTNDNENSSSTSTSTATSMSDDDKHRLYQAAAMTGDGELLRRVSVKIGLMDEDYTPGADYQSFLTAHVTWVLRNSDFIQSLDTTEKARAYVDRNFPN
jgi:hypothetical protein